MLFSSCGGCSKEEDSAYLDVDGEYYMEQYSEPEENPDDGSIKIAYKEQYGNTVTIPVQLNGMGVDMIFDTGASTTCITLAEAQYMFNKGYLTEDDVLDLQKFQTADGNISIGLRIIIRKLSIGDEIKLRNVEAVVVENQQAPLLLGQSVMQKFREVSVDRENKIIKFFE